MNLLTENFALAVKPTYFNIHNPAANKFVYWTYVSGKEPFKIMLDSTTYKFTTELSAWQAACAYYPELLDTLRQSSFISQRAYAFRAEMLLTLGEVRMAEMTADFHAKVLGIFDEALAALGARRVSKAKPKVLRVSPSKPVSWLDVRARVSLPYETEPVLISVRCLPSAIEDNTWSVRLRVPSLSDVLVQYVQLHFDELVTNLGYQGITVKDVQNGTLLDL